MTETSEISRLVENYRAWLKDRTTVKSVQGDWFEITTPFLDRHNDYVQIYAKKDDDHYILSDDGCTIKDLELSGLSIDTKKRQGILKETINGFGVDEHNGVLTTKASADNFSVRKHSLLQAILAVNDMFHLSSATVRSLFKEDVEKWLETAEIRHVSNIQLTGKSGFTHYFDFVIPRTRTAPERLARAITKPDKGTALNFIAAWTDTAERRSGDTQAVAFLNDHRPVAEPVIDALTQYNIVPIRWSMREKERERLAA